MSKRERLIVIGTGLAALIFVGDRYALTPYMQAREQVSQDMKSVSGRLGEARNRMKRAGRMEREWRDMLAGGLKTDQSVAQFQVLNAVGDWADEAGVNLTSRTPQPESRNDRTQIIRLHAIGKCTTASVARLLWRIETAPIPLKVDELTLSTNKPGTDDLSLNLVVSTIWVRPETPADARTAGGATAAPRRGAGTGRDEGI
jgi:hypothetical protein